MPLSEHLDALKEGKFHPWTEKSLLNRCFRLFGRIFSLSGRLLSLRQRQFCLKKWEKMPHPELLEPLKEDKYQSMGGENTSSRGAWPLEEDIFLFGEAFESSPEAILPSKAAKMPLSERLEPLQEEKYQSMGGENTSSIGVFTSSGGYFASRGGF